MRSDKVLPLNVAGRNVLDRRTAYYLAAYRYYGSRAVAMRGVLAEVGYRVGFDDLTMDRLRAECQSENRARYACRPRTAMPRCGIFRSARSVVLSLETADEAA